jgi:hypothetical protein
LRAVYAAGLTIVALWTLAPEAKQTRSMLSFKRLRNIKRTERIVFNDEDRATSQIQ